MSYIIDKNFVSKKDFVLERVYNTNHIIKTLKTKQAFFQKDKKDWKGNPIMVIDPDSKLKFFWNCISMFLIIFQAFLIPWMIVFYWLDEQWLLVEYSITFFFLLDMLLNFNTAYYQKGIPQKSRIKIAQNYLRTWFLVDFISLLPITELFKELKDSGLQITDRGLQFMKLLRLIRLLRLAKLKKILITIEDYISYAWLSDLFIFLRLLMITFFITHWMGCLILYIGIINQNVTETWIDHLNNDSPSALYIDSIYLTIQTMITVGYGDIGIINQDEKITIIFTMLIVCAIFPYILGSFTAFLSNRSKAKREFSKRTISINQYMKVFDIPHDIRYRVRRYLDYLWQHQQQDSINEKELQSLLSNTLQVEIFKQTRGEILKNCYPFRQFNELVGYTISGMMKQQTFSPSDQVFFQSELSNSMYFIQQGIVSIYHQQTRTIFKVLKAGTYFGEIAFFAQKPRCASAICEDFTDVLKVTYEDFSNIVRLSPQEANALDIIQRRCIYEDYSLLGVKCYLCKQQGHVALNCKEMVYKLDEEKLKSRWVYKKRVLKKYINPQTTKQKRKNVPRNKLVPGIPYQNPLKPRNLPQRLQNKVQNFEESPVNRLVMQKSPEKSTRLNFSQILQNDTLLMPQNSMESDN